MKLRTYHALLCIALVHLLFLVPLLYKSIPHTHDGELHIARIAAYYKAFTDKQFPPRWASDLNFTYGTPLFIFYYPLPGYIGSAIHAFGINLQDTFKLLLGASFIFASISFFFWAKETIPEIPAVIASLLYGLTPYHFLDLYVRGAIGELFAFIWIPLIFCMIERLQKKKTLRSFLTGSLAYALLLLSHNAFGLIFTIVICLYCLYKAKTDIKLLSVYTFMLTAGLSLSAFFWLPALYEQRFTHSDIFLGTKYADYFPTMKQLVYSPWGFGTDVSKPGGLSPQIGFPLIIIAILGGIGIAKFNKYRSQIFFWVAFLFISIFLSTSYSLPLWRQSRLLQGFEFPWRFTALSTFCIAGISIFILKYFDSKIFQFILFSSIILYSFQFVAVSSYEIINDSFYESFAHSTDFGAASTIWAAGDPIAPPKEPVQIISGNAEITRYTRSSTVHRIDVNASTLSQILDNTLYFPGWQVLMNGEIKVPIQFQDPNHRGLIAFMVPQGIHQIEISFHESPVRLVSDLVSVSVFFVLIILLLSNEIQTKIAHI